MTYYIAYGTDTKSIEDPDQIVLVGCPHGWSDLDSDELADSIDHEWHALESRGEIQALIGEKDVLRILQDILPTTPGLNCLSDELVQQAIAHILDSLNEAFTENYNSH